MVLLSACHGATEPDVDRQGAYITGPVELTLVFGETVDVPGTVLSLSLMGVPEDSRCPLDVTCVWEGNAVVEVGLAAGSGPTVPLQMNTSLDPRSVDWGDVRVTVLALEPAPVSETPIPQRDYQATVRLEPAG